LEKTRVGLLSLLLACLTILATSGLAAPGGEPAHIRSIGSWRVHDPKSPRAGAEPWTPADVLGLLDRYPEAILQIGGFDGFPPGNHSWLDLGARVDALNSLARARGENVSARSCVSFRPDIIHKFAPNTRLCSVTAGGGGCDWEGNMDGSLGESETVVKLAGKASGGGAAELDDTTAAWTPGNWASRLLVLRPGLPGEEQRRITSSTARSLTVNHPWTVPPQPGDRYEIRGSFDPAWVMRVPRAVHQKAVRELWEQQRNVCGGQPCQPPAEPLDPLAAGNRRAWPQWYDRTTIEALATDTTVPALYGPVHDGLKSRAWWRDPYFSVSDVIMDLRKPAYRSWRQHRLLYLLRDQGIDPGQPVCMTFGYKPGWHTFYDEAANGPSFDHCAVPGSGMWTGPAHVCGDGAAPGGLFDPTRYRKGEYEQAVNDFIREMIQTLADHGYRDVRIVTIDGPKYRNKDWSILDADVRFRSQLLGVWAHDIPSQLSDLQSGGDATTKTNAAAKPQAIPPAGAASSGSSSTGSPTAGGTKQPSPKKGGYMIPATQGGGTRILRPPDLEGQ
jgi:hypothetical protein